MKKIMKKQSNYSILYFVLIQIAWEKKQAIKKQTNNVPAL